MLRDSDSLSLSGTPGPRTRVVQADRPERWSTRVNLVSERFACFRTVAPGESETTYCSWGFRLLFGTCDHRRESETVLQLDPGGSERQEVKW